MRFCGSFAAVLAWIKLAGSAPRRPIIQIVDVLTAGLLPPVQRRIDRFAYG
jgi:hypothetical protein